ARGGDSIAAVGHPRILALRSFGKFYGLAGLRLGFLLGTAPFVRRFKEALGDWPVSADALAAGLAAYPDADWAARTRIRLARDAARLDKLLIACGFSIVGGTNLFRLARAPDAPRRFEALCAEGILTRPFAEAPDWLRFGLPRSRDWRRLEAVLKRLA
ncbi:MAG: aminotransferase class I/II-fold pyridoxal phosphate-dependent enzyme, partial [Caulobacteraceae bacterium]|nr:aminotransferase class I/II-fold pyridoxal phosphate-dependent enzyme [Caulobacteraceae bacterium]